MHLLQANYRIPEIPLSRFCQLLEGIYSVLEREGGKVDPLYEIVVRSHKDLSQEHFRLIETLHLNKEELVDYIGLLHFDLASCFPGWARIGRYSDLIHVDGKQIIVWKSPYVVQRSSLTQLQEYRISGKEVYMVGFTERTEFEHIDINEAYYILSGRPTFWADVQKTLSYILSTCKTYSELKQAILV